jgi:hypothetical protein
LRPSCAPSFRANWMGAGRTFSIRFGPSYQVVTPKHELLNYFDADSYGAVLSDAPRGTCSPTWTVRTSAWGTRPLGVNRGITADVDVSAAQLLCSVR